MGLLAYTGCVFLTDWPDLAQQNFETLTGFTGAILIGSWLLRRLRTTCGLRSR
jgi:hypothetical protein